MAPYPKDTPVPTELKGWLGVDFTPVPGLKYSSNYCSLWHDVYVKQKYPEFPLIRTMAVEDLWFLLYFILETPPDLMHDQYIIDQCKEVYAGPQDMTLYLWAREHWKSTIITYGRTMQRLLRNSEERIAIFSYALKPALSFFRQIKYAFETSEKLKKLFGDVLYDNPEREAWKWGEETGLYLRRKGMYKEPSLSAYGLIEGMPTGMHFSGRVYDDVVTPDLVNTPEIMQKVKDMFDMSQNLGTKDGWHVVIGTPYHHEDALQYIRHKKTSDGSPLYHLSLVPATVDGTPNGKSRYLPEARLDALRANRQMFFSQQLLDPTPQGTQRLNFSYIKEIEPSKLPERLWKFMTIDPAGVKRSKEGDSWAICVLGVEPYRDDLGASNVYLLDAVVEPMMLEEALKQVVAVYLRNGRIQQVGVEKMSLSTMEIHVSQALHAKGKAVTVENGGIKLLHPAGRAKDFRIEQALSWPLANGKFHILSSVPVHIKERFRMEMDKFPFWHDDMLDAVAYLYDIIKEYRFGKFQAAQSEDYWDRYFRKKEEKVGGWLVV